MTDPSLSDFRGPYFLPPQAKVEPSHRERVWIVCGRTAPGEKTFIHPCLTLKISEQWKWKWQLHVWIQCRVGWNGSIGVEKVFLYFSLPASSMAFPLQQLCLVCFSLLCFSLLYFPTCLTTAFSYVVQKSRETMLSKDQQSSLGNMDDSADAGPAARVPAQPHSNQATPGRLFNLFCLSCLTWEISY